MKQLMGVISILAFALVILPPLAYLAGALENRDAVSALMLTGTVIWFAAAPFWLRRRAAIPPGE